MNDKELCEMFGTTVEDVESVVAKVESGDYSDFDFGKAIDGRPMQRERMQMVSAPIGESRIAAITRITKELGISRAEFIRRAIDHELLATG